MNTAYIGIGSNIGDPIHYVKTAISALSKLERSNLEICSSFYITAPIGKLDQPNFVNAVVKLKTEFSASDLLHHLQKIESDNGRLRLEENGPRTLDLDILLYGQLTTNSVELAIPHPQLHLRAFVLYPLHEIAPEINIPGRGNISAWIPFVANQKILKLSRLK